MKRLGFPLALSLVLIAAYAILRFVAREAVSEVVHTTLLASAYAALSVLVVRIVSYVLFDVLFRRRKSREAPALLKVSFSIVTYSLLFALIYSLVLEKDLSAILATSAVVTIIIGLALQDTLGNFFAGLSLHIEQPYYIGDAIKVGDMWGRVESVTWRTTAIRTNNNTLIIFPNSKVARESLEVFPLNKLTRRVFRFPAPYAAPPERVLALIQEALRGVPGVESERPPRIRIAEFADSQVTYEVLYWIKDYMLVQDIDAQMRERIWYAYRRSGIDVPFPVRHVLFERLRLEKRAGDEGYQRLLRDIDLLEPLTDVDIEQLAEEAVRFVYAPGELILKSGDEGGSMFVVNRGSVEVTVDSAGGAPRRVAVLRRGDFFGEMALFTGEPRTANVSALEEAEVIEIRKTSVEHLLNRNGLLAEAFSQKIAERQAALAEHARVVPKDEQDRRTENILLRIKRFFNL